MGVKKIGWYFPVENTPSDKLVDNFSDSKFGIDKWTSFAREIIQNSLDVPKEENGKKMTVKVDMSLKYLPLDRIPGGNELKDIIKKAKDNASNHQTKQAYQKGIECLEKDFVPCLKVSDYNTLGVRAGRDNEWGAFVYDEGKSKKRRPGSAGSHGVGKKAPFIISSVNTVFYSTYTYEGDRLSQGKCSLVNWDDDNGNTRSPLGWYGWIDESADRRNKIQPIDNKCVDLFLDKFFIRSEHNTGTDVIIVGVNFENENEIKDKIINAVVENFFVALEQRLLEVNIFGEEINADNLNKIIDIYFKDSRKKKLKNDSEIENIKYGNLSNYYNTYVCEEPKEIKIEYDGICYGNIEIYFSLVNDKARKYYCIFREHGMKIKDVSLSSVDQPFTAVVIVKDPIESDLEDSQKINARLSAIENAAHDTFVVDDPDIECDPITKTLVKIINEKVNGFIIQETEIQVTEETPLYGLDDMLSIQGTLSTKIRKDKPKMIAKKRKIKKKGKGKKALTYDDGVTSVGGEKQKNHKNKGERKPAQAGNEFEATLFNNFLIPPFILHLEDEFILKIISNENLENAFVQIIPISVDGTLVPIEELVESASSEECQYNVSGNKILGVNLKSSKQKIIKFKLKKNLNYSLECEVRVGERNE